MTEWTTDDFSQFYVAATDDPALIHADDPALDLPELDTASALIVEGICPECLGKLGGRFVVEVLVACAPDEPHVGPIFEAQERRFGPCVPCGWFYTAWNEGGRLFGVRLSEATAIERGTWLEFPW